MTVDAVVEEVDNVVEESKDVSFEPFVIGRSVMSELIALLSNVDVPLVT